MIDLIVIGILVIFAVMGYYKGLVRTALTLISSIVALLLAFVVSPVTNTILEMTPVYQWVTDGVQSKVSEINFIGGIQSQAATIMEEITWLPSVIVEQVKMNNNPAMHRLLGVSQIEDYVSMYITQILVGLVALLISWLIIKLMLNVAVHMTSSIVEHIPIISGVNKQLGLVLGILKGWLTLSIVICVLPLFSQLPMLQDLMKALDTSFLLKWLYENNLVLIGYNYLMSSKGKW